MTEEEKNLEEISEEIEELEDESSSEDEEVAEAEEPEVDPNTWRALRGLNIGDSDGGEKRYNAGDKIENMSEDELAAEIAAGNVAPWIERDTSQVVVGGEGASVFGVSVRHHKSGNLTMKGVGN